MYSTFFVVFVFILTALGFQIDSRFIDVLTNKVYIIGSNDYKDQKQAHKKVKKSLELSLLYDLNCVQDSPMSVV